MIGTEPGEDTLCHQASAAFTSYRAGEREAFDRLVGLVTPLLWRTVRSQGVDTVAAEDVVQTIWMRLLHSSDAIRDPQTIVKWLITAARREAWRTSKRARTEVSHTTALLDEDGRELTVSAAHQSPATDDLVLEGDRQRQLWDHVKGLPDRCRELISVIAFADRPDYALIAESLGMPVGSIGPTRGRCLAKLRQVLAEDPHWEGSAS